MVNVKKLCVRVSEVNIELLLDNKIVDDQLGL